MILYIDRIFVLVTAQIIDHNLKCGFLEFKYKTFKRMLKLLLVNKKILIQINIILYVSPSKLSKAPSRAIRGSLTGKLVPKQRKRHSPSTDLTLYGRKWLSSSSDLSTKTSSRSKLTRNYQRQRKRTGKESQGSLNKWRKVSAISIGSKKEAWSIIDRKR